MIKDALAWFKDKLVDAAAPQPVDVSDPKHIKQFIDTNGDIKVVKAHALPRTFECQTPAAFVRLCDRYNATRAHRGENCLFAYLDDESQRENIVLKYETSDEWHALIGLLKRANEGITPKELAFLLRTDLRNVLGEEERAKLEKQVGTLKVRTDEAVSVATTRGQDTMGASIDRQASPDVELPSDLLNIRIRPLKNATVSGFRADVQLYIEPELDTKQWIIRAMPDQLHRARAEAVATLHSQIDELITEDSSLQTYH